VIKDYFPTAADFVRFSEEENQADCLEINLKIRPSDEQFPDTLSQNSECRKRFGRFQ
jgi:hypothetical protein